MSLIVYGAPLSPYVRKLRLFLAEKGLVAAQMNMARMHLQHDGVAPDLVEAERWLRLAAAQDHAKARELIEELELDRAPAMADTGFGELANSVVGWLRDRRRR